MGYRKIKRFLDIIISIVVTLILLPFAVMIGVALKIERPREKIIFKQERIGQQGKTFLIFKFRTMNEDSPHYLPSEKVKDAERFCSRIGNILRSTGLDEIPQLLNVIRGEMSIVGPRPLIAEEGDIHNSRLKTGIYNICPGITGLAQVHGGKMISNTEKLHWDLRYLQNMSFLLDCNICLTTFLQLCGLKQRDPLEREYPERQAYALKK